jgi:hypothetical protein
LGGGDEHTAGRHVWPWDAHPAGGYGKVPPTSRTDGRKAHWTEGQTDQKTLGTGLVQRIIAEGVGPEVVRGA